MAEPDARFYYDEMMTALDAGVRPDPERFAAMCHIFRAAGYRAALAEREDVLEFARQFARTSGDSPACECVSCRASRAMRRADDDLRIRDEAAPLTPEDVAALDAIEPFELSNPVLADTGVTANTWQSAARRLAEENRKLRAKVERVEALADEWADGCYSPGVHTKCKGHALRRALMTPQPADAPEGHGDADEAGGVL